MCEAERWRAITSQMPPQLANGMLTQAAVSRGQAGYTVRSWRFADDSMLCRRWPARVGHGVVVGAGVVSGARVLNKRRLGKPEGSIYIGRPSKWGNPFEIGKDGTRAEVIAKHRTWICDQPALLASLPELRGRDLVCWCAPAPCHGDTLLEIANAT